MARVGEFARHLRDNIQWEDEAFYREALEMYADAINEAAYGWYPRSLRAWLGWFFGAMCIGAMTMWLVIVLLMAVWP